MNITEIKKSVTASDGSVVEWSEKKFSLKNGVELTYQEYGEENNEILLCGQFYFITFQPFIRELGKFFHVYAIEMRIDGPNNYHEPDGVELWPDQHAEDFYNFAMEMGISQFIYLGKCHGSTVGWSLLEHHPEVLKAFIPISLTPEPRGFVMPEAEAPSVKQQLVDFNAWCKTCLRNEKLIPLKRAEVDSLSGGLDSLKRVMANKYKMGFPPSRFPTDESIYDYFRNIHIPMMLIYGAEDVGYASRVGMINQMLANVEGIKVVIYQGEKHFIEMDIPEKLAEEAHFYIQQVNKYC